MHPSMPLTAEVINVEGDLKFLAQSLYRQLDP